MDNLSFNGSVYTGFHNRLINLLFALILSVLFVYLKQETHPIASRIDFSDSASKIRVKVSGNVLSPGIYNVNDINVTDGVIKMANNGLDIFAVDKTVSCNHYVKNGSEIIVASHGIVTVGVMTVKERILLHIPLKISEMSENEFLDVPGIGSVLANNIIKYRQNNGGKIELIDLRSVTGIGINKYNQLYKYFN